MVTDTGFLLKTHDTLYKCASKINGLLREKQNHSDIFLFPLVDSFISVITNGVPGQIKTLYYIVSGTTGDAKKDTRNIDLVLETHRFWY